MPRKIFVVAIAIAVIAAIVVGGIFAVQNLLLDWKMLDVMYINKAGVSWWATFTINGLLFGVGIPVAAIVTLAGLPWESKVLNLLWFGQNRGDTRKPHKLLVAGYKLAVFGITYLVVTFIFTDQMRLLSLLTQAAASGVGNWGSIQQAITLIFTPGASTATVAGLVATIEVEYTIFMIFMTLLLAVIGVRVALDLVHYIARIGRATRRPSVRLLASIFFLVVLGLFWGLLNVPYLEVDLGTQFYVLWLLIMFIFFCGLTVIFFGLTVFGKYGRAGNVPRLNPKLGAILGIATAVLIIGPGLYTGYLVSGPLQGAMWKEGHWDPLMTKELHFSNWAGGLDVEEVPYKALINDTGVSDGDMLGHARLWDFTASRNKMRSQTIANWMALADSDIVYSMGREYWMAPYSLSPPTQDDFHSKYLLYTHAEGATALDASSQTGEFLTPSQFQSVFGVNANFPIYYGEAAPDAYEDGFDEFVVVDTSIAPETGAYSWEGEPDYILSGAELALKKLAWSIGDLSFAWFSFPDPTANVLMHRNIVERVQTILLPYMYTDYDPYLVFDRLSQEAYYCVPIYSAFDLQLQYAQTDYLRLLGFAIVNCADGEITWVRNPNADPAGFFIETMYEEWYDWDDAPTWLEDQLRYPEDLIDAQLAVDFYYHVTDPWVWRSQADFFEKPHSQPDVHYVLFPEDGQLKWVGYQAARYIRHEAQKLAGFYLFVNGPEVGRTIFARAGSVDPVTQTSISPLFGVDAAIESFEQQARSDLVLLEPYRIGNRLLVPLSGRLVYLFPVYAESHTGDSLVETLTFVGLVDAEDITQVAYAGTAAEAYASFFFGYNATVSGVEFIEAGLDPFDVDIGEEAVLSFVAMNGNSTASPVNATIQLAMHTDDIDVWFHDLNITPHVDSGQFIYNISETELYYLDITGGSITLNATSLDAGVYLATFILELRIVVDGEIVETEYFYLTIRTP